MNNFYVYFLRRPDRDDPLNPSQGQPFYVGKGSNGRKYEHRKEAKALINKTKERSIKIKIIHKLWKHGLDFNVDVFYKGLTEQEAFEYEIQTISTHGRINNKTGCLANLTDGGEGPSMSDEIKQRISEANRGKVRTEEAKQKVSEKNKGKTRTEEVKKRMSESRKGKYTGEDNPMYGRKHKKETIEKLRRINEGENNKMYGKKRPDLSGINRLRVGPNNPNFGKPMSEEQRKKISQAGKGENSPWWGKKGEDHPCYGKTVTPEAREKMRKAKVGFIPWNKGLRMVKVNG